MRANATATNVTLPKLPYIGKSGSTLFTAVPATATPPPASVAVNGHPVAITPGPASAAFLSYTLASPVKPGDMVTVGGQAVANYAGRLEFGLPKPQVGLGYMVAHPQFGPTCLYTPSANWATRLGPWTPAPHAVDAAGNPTSIPGASYAIAVWSTPGNGVDATALPSLAGTFVLRYDATDPQHATDLTLGADGPTSCTLVSSCPGVGGVGIRKVYRIEPATTNNAATFKVNLTHPTNAPSFTNFAIISPGNDPEVIDPMQPDASIMRMLQIGPKGPSCLRWMDSINNYGAVSNARDVGDLPPSAPSSWGNPQATTSVAMVEMRPLAVPSQIVATGGPFPFSDLKAWYFGGRWIGEVVTATPHGFSTGDVISFKGPSGLAFTAGGVAATMPAAFGPWPVVVTSPTTFVINGWSPNIKAGTSINIDAPFKLAGWSATRQVPPGTLTPLEFAARFTSQFEGCYFWVNIPWNASDALVASMAERILPHLGASNKVIFEVGNENWNYGYPHAMANGMISHVAGYPDRLYAAKRTAEMAAVFKKAMGTRASDVLACLAWQFESAAHWFKACAAAGYKADVLAVAPYLDLPPSWTEVNSWTTPQQHDIFRAWLAFDPKPAAWFADWKAGIADYEAVMGPTLHAGYEVALEAGLPAGANPTGAQILNWYAHPDCYLTEQLFYGICQQAEFDLLCCESLIMNVGSQPNYGYYQYQTQLPGRGDGSDGKAANPTLSTAWQPTVSVRGQAWLDWQTDVLLG